MFSTLKSASLYSFAVFPLHSLSVSHCSPCNSTWSRHLKILRSQKGFEELLSIAVRKTVGQVSHYDQDAEMHFRNIFDFPAIPRHKKNKYKYKYILGIFFDLPAIPGHQKTKTKTNTHTHTNTYSNTNTNTFLTYLPSRGTKALSPWENCILCHNTLALILG